MAMSNRKSGTETARGAAAIRHLRTVAQAFLVRAEDWRAIRFLPLAVVIAYWLGPPSLLATVSLVLPSLLALKEVTRKPVEPWLPNAEERDFITPFGNRAFAYRRANDAIRMRRTGAGSAVIRARFLDLDAWRLRQGAGFADRLVRTLAEELRGVLRDRDAIARTEGSDFLIILDPTRKGGEEAVEDVARRVQSAMERIIHVDQIPLAGPVAVGICPIARAPAPSAEAWLEAALVAAEEAALAGGGLRRFDSRMQHAARTRDALRADLEAALENGEIRVWYQPQVNARTGAPVGMEALARWHHPEHGVLAPSAFLPEVARQGLSERLSEVIMHQAFAKLRNLSRAGLEDLTVGVNLSTDELRNPSLVDKLKWEADRFDLEPSNICIEVLETVICETDDDIVARNLRALARVGFRIDLDDFGTGHAAIANIRRFSVTRIKIDRSFVAPLSGDAEASMLIDAMVRMARSLGVETLAEGVETPGDQALLAELGVTAVQGYAIARPMPDEEIGDWLHERRKRTGSVLRGNGAAGGGRQRRVS